MKEEWIIAFAYVNKTIEKKEQKQKQMTHCVSTWHKLQKKRGKKTTYLHGNISKEIVNIDPNLKRLILNTKLLLSANQISDVATQSKK